MALKWVFNVVMDWQVEEDENRGFQGSVFKRYFD